MKPSPWRYVSSWSCIACGECCKYYSVNISFAEYFRVVKMYGVGATELGLTECYLKKRLDGRCVFQYPAPGPSWLCGLQHMKPKVCKLWPFTIASRPAYGHEQKALYWYNNRSYYVYVDPKCRGILWGSPSWELVHRTIPEFIRLSSEEATDQIYSTSRSVPFKLVQERGSKKRALQRP